jgi:formylglycine-generating enzyme required for sulfatase activity
MFIPDEGVIVELGRMAVVCARAEYETGCDSGDYDACADFGLLLWDDRNSNASVMYAYLLDGCNRAGRMDACLTAAMATEQGRGVTADAERAVQLYQRLCEQGNAAGCAEVARVEQPRIETARLEEEARQAEEARRRELFRQAAGTFVLIPSGTFMMGSPLSESEREGDETQHRVTLTQGFYIQTTEVTQGQWQALMGNNPSYFSSCGSTCPVEQVSWTDAVSFANALSLAEGLSPCYDSAGNVVGGSVYTCEGYRLPTEAEWEYAARAGSVESRYGGIDQVAWHSGNSGGAPHAVGQLQANAWGLYDMLGNVWEWTHDWYGSEYGAGAVSDPVGPSGGSYRVFRGGCWYGVAAYVRAADRGRNDPGHRLNDLGFRLARSAR